MENTGRKSNRGLTSADALQLQEYLQAIDELAQREPPRLPDEIWEKAWTQIQATGEIPAEYRDRIGVTQIVDKETGKKQRGYIDIAWERWNTESRQLDIKYHDVIIKALRYALSKEMLTETQSDVLELLQALLKNVDNIPAEQVRELLTTKLLASPFLPMLNAAAANNIMNLSIKGMTPDTFSKKAVFETADGRKVTIEHFDKLQGVLSTSAKKILDTALLYLTSNNYYGAARNSLTPTVEIPLKEYGEACGYSLTPQIMDTAEEQRAEDRRVQERIKELKKNIRRDLHDISEILWTGEETRGNNKGNYKEMRIVSSHGISKGLIRINFDVDAAAYFAKSYIMQYPTALLKHDNRKPNAYVIGRKIAFHNSLDRNAAAGTNNTLAVKTLLADAPEIPTIEDIKARGQRNWKDKIKKPLEIALDENITVGLISKWEYRDPATGKTFNSETSQPMTWTQYSKLMVDFIMVDPPDQSERRATRAKEKEQAAASKDKPRRKRGRPKKEKPAGGV